MNKRFIRAGLLTGFATLALGTAAWSADTFHGQPLSDLLAGATTQPAPDAKVAKDTQKTSLEVTDKNPTATTVIKDAKDSKDAKKEPLDLVHKQQEMGVLPDGIHTLSDGSICVKNGPGSAMFSDSPDGQHHGCQVGCNRKGGSSFGTEGDLVIGVMKAVLMDPKEGEKLGISAGQAERLKKAYYYTDNEGTFPEPLIKLYEQYLKAAAGDDKTNAEKAMMDKVRDIGQAYLNTDIKKVKDIKDALSKEQAEQLRAVGAKFLRPNEKPVS